jgi:hypothetical protein
MIFVMLFLLTGVDPTLEQRVVEVEDSDLYRLGR